MNELNIIVGGVSLSVVIAGLVELLKRFGVPSKFLTGVAALAGVSIVLGVEGITLESAVKGFIVGLSASGLYDLTLK